MAKARRRFAYILEKTKQGRNNKNVLYRVKVGKVGKVVIGVMYCTTIAYSPVLSCNEGLLYILLLVCVCARTVEIRKRPKINRIINPIGLADFRKAVKLAGFSITPPKIYIYIFLI